ncbi:hypothetical protein BH10ACT11_BH10ACT11_11380 [soil metagenome]
MRARGRGELFCVLGVAIVLADSSIVTLALPDILRRFDTSVFQVSFVLTAFNLFFAALIVPAARLAQRRVVAVSRVGFIVFGAASVVCAVAPSIAVLIAARCMQAAGGAAVVASSIELLSGWRGSHRSAAPVLVGASVAGLAVGPAIGGVLTQALSWESIFAFQVPVIAMALFVGRPAAPARAEAETPGPRLAPELALGLISAGLTGALFLLVVMLTQGWGYSPLAAAAVVSAMPVATLAAQPLVRRAERSFATIGAGAVLVAGGLGGLALLPGADWEWTLIPQTLIGFGLALSLPGLTLAALSSGDPGGRRAAATLGARHAGVVIGIVALTPVFAAQLDRADENAQRAGTALLLDASLSPGAKLDLGSAIADRIAAADGRLPALGPAFDTVDVDSDQQGELDQLRRSLDDEVDKAATSAFSLSFLFAALLALAAALPIGLGLRRR